MRSLPHCGVDSSVLDALWAATRMMGMGWLCVAFDLLKFIFLKGRILLFRGVIGKQGYQCQGKRVLYEVNPWGPQVDPDHHCSWEAGAGLDDIQSSVRWACLRSLPTKQVPDFPLSLPDHLSPITVWEQMCGTTICRCPRGLSLVL